MIILFIAIQVLLDLTQCVAYLLSIVGLMAVGMTMYLSLMVSVTTHHPPPQLLLPRLQTDTVEQHSSINYILSLQDKYVYNISSCAQVLADPTATPAIAAIAGAPSNTVCTNLRPFKIGVHSDNLEYGNACQIKSYPTLFHNSCFMRSMFPMSSLNFSVLFLFGKVVD